MAVFSNLVASSARSVSTPRELELEACPPAGSSAGGCCVSGDFFAADFFAADFTATFAAALGAADAMGDFVADEEAGAFSSELELELSLEELSSSGGLATSGA